MKEIPELYPKRQGRPEAPDTIDLETGQGSLYHNYISLKEEYAKVEELLDRLLNEQIQKLEQMVIEAKQIKLHLASMSDEPIDEESVEEEE